MTSQPAPRTPPASGGTGLIITISAATIITVALEAGFVAAASWLLLPFMLLVIVFMTGVVLVAVGRVLEGGTVASPKRPPRPARAPVGEPETPRVSSRPVLGH